MWERLIPTLAGHYHIVARDYPGFGLSGPTAHLKKDHDDGVVDESA
jgi:hypothetical protein